MRISVIIPVYNAEKTIIKTLQSVVDQTVKPFEVIIVDDGSKDSSSSLITSFISQNSSFRFRFVQKENGGVSSARNAGLKLAKGDLIALLDSDDEWFSDKLQKQLNVIDRNSDFSFIGGLIFKPKSVKEKLTNISVSMLIFKNYFQPSTVIFKKEIINTIGLFDETQRYAEEGNYFIRIANMYKCGLMNEHLVLYDQGKSGFGQSGLSANLKEMEKGELRNLKFAYDSKFISFSKYSFAVGFSVLKYFRRILIVKLKKIW
jgi:glycosyltransferase involved in cell wall biosynthesis